jgi:hypothetical protein
MAQFLSWSTALSESPYCTHFLLMKHANEWSSVQVAAVKSSMVLRSCSETGLGDQDPIVPRMCEDRWQKYHFQCKIDNEVLMRREIYHVEWYSMLL